ncbi:MAG: L-idonate 5-dehydrogenase [Gammaproteobacteria bacterium]|nr:L-idonate 5-dehydrogenase [Gammaproteobacteria bacterium]
MPTSTQAIVIHAAKDLRIEQSEIVEPGPGEIQIATATGGVCGSDLHYYNHGGFGTVRLKEPMILGHEVAGHIVATGEGVSGFSPGDLIAVSPSRPCYHCEYCQQGRHNHCHNMRFYGSAMPWPHIQGAFRQSLTVDATQCVKADGLTAGEAAMAEPFSVVLHATRRAGELLGKRVLITGCGPIGVLCVIAARRAGATEIVVTDIADNALSHASRCGADRTINVANDPEALQQYSHNKGYFHLMFECSGVQDAMIAGLSALQPGSVLMQLGLGGDMSIPMMQLTAREIELRGSFRFHSEFALAVELMQRGLVDLKPLITHTYPLSEAETAFRMANDRNSAMKAQIDFSA